MQGRVSSIYVKKRVNLPSIDLEEYLGQYAALLPIIDCAVEDNKLRCEDELRGYLQDDRLIFDGRTYQSIGYPAVTQEKQMVRSKEGGNPVQSVEPVLSAEDVVRLQDEARTVTVDESLMDYVMEIVEATRNSDLVQLGVSPRGTLALVALGQAHAMVEGRDYVIPDDIKNLAVPALAHRIILSMDYGPKSAGITNSAQVIRNIINSVRVPL